MSPVEVLRPLLSGDERFAVTGATGWFGRRTLDLLDELGLGERLTAYATTQREVRTRAGRKVPVRPLSELPAQRPAPTHLLHFAFLTRDRVAQAGHAQYVADNVAITLLLLESIARFRPRGLVVTSSGAVYGDQGRLASDLGTNPYGALKHLDELALRGAMTGVGGVTAVARVFSVAGAGITKPELYALGSLVLMAQRGAPLEVRARGRVVRSYAAVDDVVALALWSVLRGQSCTFDSGGDVVEIGDLARLVAAVHDLPDTAVRRTVDPAAPENRYVGDTAAYDALAVDAGLVPQRLEGLVRATSEWLRVNAAG